MNRTLSTLAPAKLNLTLAVGPADRSLKGRGRHPVASLMVALHFGDTLDFSLHQHPSPTGTTAWSRAFAPDAPRHAPVDWPIDTDLAFRAHAAVEAALGQPLPLHATLHKRIPAGMGLGGGSADAAAVLHTLTRRLAQPHQHPPIDVSAIAQALGADVSFALHVLQHPHQPAAVATGFGEQLQPFALPQPLHAALLLPDFACPTAAVYAAFDTLTPHASPVDPHATRALRDQLQSGQTLADVALFNDLTPAAQLVQPALTDLLNTLASAGLQPHLTGSGAALFLPARSAEHAQQRAIQAAQLTGQTCLPVHSLTA